MDESDPAWHETVMDAVDRPHRVAHVLERVNRERHIELP
jgi:hypothetical protein